MSLQFSIKAPNKSIRAYLKGVIEGMSETDDKQIVEIFLTLDFKYKKKKKDC